MTQENLIELAASIESEIKNIFPLSFFSCQYSNKFCPSIYGLFTIGNGAEEYPHGIINNDPLITSFYIWIKGDLLTLEWSQGNLLIKPENPHMAYSRAKTGMRAKTGNADQVKKAIVSFFKKLPEIIKQNESKLCESHKPLFVSKNLI